MFLRIAPIRRAIIYIFIFIASGYLIHKTSQYYSGVDPDTEDVYRSKPLNTKYINENGTFLLNPGYEILQFVVTPLPAKFTELFNYLDQQMDLKQYFTFVPHSAYHVTLSKLKEAKLDVVETVSILVAEQQILDQDETYTTSNGKQLLGLNNQEIRLEIELPNHFLEYTIKPAQTRWTETFPNLIAQHHTSFYITLAYQHARIPTKDTFEQLRKSVKEWQEYPFEINLDPIEICGYNDLISYIPILPDQVEL